MGHYASEMDPNWNKESRDIEPILKAGFEFVWMSGSRDFVKCGGCFSILEKKDWKKHRAWHNKMMEGK